MIKYTTEDNIALLTIGVEDQSMNVLNDASVKALEESIDKFLVNKDLKGAIITSSHNEFMAGADLKMITSLDTAEEISAMATKLHQLFRKIELSERPIVAAMNGTALGGGYELCLACHHRIAVKNSGAQIGLPEVTLGLLPGAGGTQRLPRMIGFEKALPLLVEGRRLKPEQAEKIGLVDALVENQDQLIAAAKSWITDNPSVQKPWDQKGFRIPGGDVHSGKGFNTFSAGSALVAGKTQNNYPAPQAILNAVYEGLPLQFDRACEIEVRYFTQLATGKVAKNMIRTLFFNMNKANALSNRPNVEKRKVNKVAILGAGMMGAGIAYVSAMAGIETVLKDINLEGAEKGKDYSRNLLKKRIERGKMDEATAERVLENIKCADDYKDLENADLVIEAVFEDRKLKADVTKDSEAIIDEKAVFASNTSTLPITGLAEASKRPERFIGLHFFSPVDKMQLVEIILGEKTGDEALGLAMDYVKQIRKTPIVVRDGRGFYTSRIFKTYVSEGIELLAEGVEPALIENAGKQAGMPVGPLAVADEVSIELLYRIFKQTEKDGIVTKAAAKEVSTLFMEKLDRPGKKAKKGFYEYPENGKKHLWSGLKEHFKPLETQPDLQEVKDRLLYVQSLETVRCMDEGIVMRPEDADIGSILGWGFPPYTGGAISFIDFVGIENYVKRAEELAGKFGERFKPTDSLKAQAEKGEGFYS
ncbi:MAG: 3-hydroxyacyl-CoA dehydrogenase NAD-binding domain-containing protein [Chitinophagales bacterium]